MTLGTRLPDAFHLMQNDNFHCQTLYKIYFEKRQIWLIWQWKSQLANLVANRDWLIVTVLQATACKIRTIYESLVFSERELTFTFAICYRPSVCLSVVCNARAPYSGRWNFPQYFYSIRYLDHPLTWHPLKISRRSSQGNPSAVGVKHKRGSEI